MIYMNMSQKIIRQRGIDEGMGYYLIVISNNQTNTDWGHQTDASLDGKIKRYVYESGKQPSRWSGKEWANGCIEFFGSI